MVSMRSVDWTNSLFLIGYHIALCVALPIYLVLGTPTFGLWISLVALVILCGIGVTSLYHRHYSHRTYGLNKTIEVITLFFSTLAVQGSALQWAYDHRLHHRHVDTEKDPYAITKGFWHAHFIWMLSKRPKFDPAGVHDLMKNRLVVLQDKYYGWLVAATNGLVVLFFGAIFNDYIGAFVILFLLRLFINHHTTWFINSLAHTWGVKPYSREHSAVNNWIISLLTYGEGYHNYHHTFAGDYRNGTRWYHFDPTKGLIWTLNKLGLAHELRTTDKTLIARRLIEEDKKLMLDKTYSTPYVKSELAQEIELRANALQKRLVDLGNALREYKQMKKAGTIEKVHELRWRAKNLKRRARQELRAWSKYCDRVLCLKPTLG